MSAGTDALKAAWRNFVTDGIPASGANEPNKADIRAGLDALAIDIAAASVGDLGEAVALLQPMVDDAQAAAAAASATVGEIYGDPVNIATSLEPGYINKTTGAEAEQAGWRRTEPIAITADHYLTSDNATPVAGSSAGCNLAFYDASLNYLGYANFLDVGSAVRAGDVSANVAFVRAANPAATAFNLFAMRYIPPASVSGLSDVIGQFYTPDRFLDDDVVSGYLERDTGALAANANWESTDFIPVATGSTVTYSGTGNGTLVASVAVYDADKNYLETLLSADGATVDATLIINNPLTAFVRASAQVVPAHSFFAGIMLSPEAVPGTSTDTFPTFFSPTEGYALKSEPMTMYARGICADRAFDLAWNLSESNDHLATVSEAAAGDVAVELIATNHLGATKTLASFPVHVSDTPANPAAMRNFIHLGDSTVECLARAGVQGALTNEISRRLNGTGTALLTGAQSPAPFALTNTRFLGTLGDQPVKHEGRAGWRASHYTGSASVGVVTNAFWNPSTSKFDLAYYLSQSGFNAGTLAGGVDATGSNLTIIVQLGWNDVYSKTAAASKADMAALIDAIHATHPDTDIIVTGLTAGAQINIKNFSGSRFVSERRIFEDAVLSFGTAYRELTGEKSNTSFLQTSHIFDPALGYDTTTKSLSIRSTATLTGAIDHVHPNALGYAMLADAIFYKLIHEYCQ